MCDELFYICVDILSILGDLTGMTYNQINVLVFCVLWPLHTLYLFVLSYRARRKLCLLNKPNSKPKRLPLIFPTFCNIFKIENK